MRLMRGPGIVDKKRCGGEEHRRQHCPQNQERGQCVEKRRSSEGPLVHELLEHSGEAFDVDSCDTAKERAVLGYLQR